MRTFASFCRSLPVLAAVCLMALDPVRLAAGTLVYAPAPPDNPLKGFIPYARQQTNFPNSMEWDYIRLSDLMKGPDQFTWEPFEAKLNAVASRGHQFYARFYMEWPGKKTGVPQYLIDAGLKMRVWTNTNTQPFPPAIDHTPDYEDPALRSALTNFIHALGKRYDGDPRIGFIGLGLLGTWGEWHNSPNDKWFASKTVQREVMDAYEASFKKTKLVARYPAGTNDARYADNSHRAMGYHDDSFAWATVHTGKKGEGWFFETLLRKAGAVEKWRQKPIGGEVRPEVWDCLFNEKSCAPKGQEFDRCVEVTHVSWLSHEGIFRKPLNPAVRERAIRAVQSMGYELFIQKSDIKQDQQEKWLDVSITITNTGVAPFYYDWPVELAVFDTASGVVSIHPAPWKLTTILPGEPSTVWRERIEVQNRQSGRHQLLLRVPNPIQKGIPLRFANREQDAHLAGWVSLGGF